MVRGAVQGPTELLPVSSSAHLTLIPWLAGWDWDDQDPELRKSFEIALHAGAAAALLVGQRRVDHGGPAPLPPPTEPGGGHPLARRRPLARRAGRRPDGP